jgi:hypothetical protein
VIELDGMSNQNAGLSNEEFARYVENHDRNMEKIHETDKIGRATQTPSHSNSGTLKKTKNAKAIASGMKPSTIMRLQDRDLVVIDKADINEATSNASDVIILDPPPSNISVTTGSGGGDQQQIDLKDILGENWPAAAGEAASILNSNDKVGAPISTKNMGTSMGNAGYSSSSSSTGSSNQLTMRNSRNKSSNPLSHLMSSKGANEKNSRTMRSKGTGTEGPLILFESDTEQHKKSKYSHSVLM